MNSNANQDCPVCGRVQARCNCPGNYRGGEDEPGKTLAGVLVVVFLCLLLATLVGCGTTETLRNPEDAKDVAEEAACPPLPPCDIPPGANAKQLASALWGCVLEYRGLYARCAHVVKPAKVDQLPPQAYGLAYCHLTNPPVCFDQVAPPVTGGAP
jgi:hypothetical protein